MNLKSLLLKVSTAKNPYNPTISDFIRETNYISWRKYLRKNSLSKIPLFLKLIDRVDRSVKLPLYQVVENLFINDANHPHNLNFSHSQFISSCFRNSSLPPIGLMVLSLFFIANNKPSLNAPKIVHHLGYASELIQIGNFTLEILINSLSF